MARRLVLSATIALAACSVAGASASQQARRTHPSKTETAAMLRAVPAGQKLCYAQTAWISGVDRRYGVVVTQPACGASTYVHQWLKRGTTSAGAAWRVVEQRSGTIDHPAGCAKSKLIPADVRCS